MIKKISKFSLVFFNYNQQNEKQLLYSAHTDSLAAFLECLTSTTQYRLNLKPGKCISFFSAYKDGKPARELI